MYVHVCAVLMPILYTYCILFKVEPHANPMIPSVTIKSPLQWSQLWYYGQAQSLLQLWPVSYEILKIFSFGSPKIGQNVSS